MHDFRKKKLLNLKCLFDSLYIVCLKHLSLHEEKSKIRLYIYWYSCYSSQTLMELLELLEEFSKSNKTSNFIHIHSVDAEMFHTEGRTNGRKDRDRQTYMTKLIFTFISFVKAPKNEAILI